MTCSCFEALPNKVSLNSHPQAFCFIIKGGLHGAGAGCSLVLDNLALTYCRNVPLLCHLSSVTLLSQQCFGWDWLCTAFKQEATLCY